MLGIAMYVDNLQRQRYGVPLYDVPLVTENWEADMKIVFTGNNFTTDYVRNIVDSTVQVVPIGVCIGNPRDIPTAMNACIDYAYNTLKLSALAMLHADTYLTEEGMHTLQEYYARQSVISIPYMSAQLYSELWIAHFGAVLSKVDDQIRCDPTSDGAIFDRLPVDIGGDNSLLLDIGYMTIANYKTKMYSHNYVWPDPFKQRVLDAFDKDVDNGLRMAYKTIKSVKQCALTSIDVNAHAVLLDKLHLWDEYRHCMHIMRDI